VSLISNSVDSGFGCCGCVFGKVFQGFLVGFEGLLGWGTLGADLGVFGEGFDGGFNCYLGFEFHVGFGCYGCFQAGRA
jgi:hypothetical protein